MEKIRKKLDSAIIGAQNRLLSKRKGSDQLIVMFIIIVCCKIKLPKVAK
ncbi:MAG: hypothetical protein MR646_03385 [Agathobacter sp.]|nr:hypothetical protein [Agathobacter sp.]